MLPILVTRPYPPFGSSSFYTSLNYRFPSLHGNTMSHWPMPSDYLDNFNYLDIYLLYLPWDSLASVELPCHSIMNYPPLYWLAHIKTETYCLIVHFVVDSNSTTHHPLFAYKPCHLVPSTRLNLANNR